ncbi:hypothetical protein [Dactylosporangium sp. NPDC005555]
MHPMSLPRRRLLVAAAVGAGLSHGVRSALLDGVSPRYPEIRFVA